MYTYIGNIKNLPKIDIIPEEKKDDLVGNPEFEKIRQNIRHKVISKIAGGNEQMIEDAVITYSGSFDRYHIDPMVVDQLGKLLGMRYTQARVQIQNPGQTTTMHFDDLDIGYVRPYEPSLPRFPFTPEDISAFDNDPSIAVRMFIFLEDSIPGQGLLFNEVALTKWKAGDVVYFDWRTIPHATFNVSYWPRKIIRITGMKTEKTDTLIAKQGTSLVYPLNQ